MVVEKGGSFRLASSVIIADGAWDPGDIEKYVEVHDLRALTGRRRSRAGSRDVELPRSAGGGRRLTSCRLRFTSPDGVPGGSAHVHLSCTESYVVIGGRGRPQPFSYSGFQEINLDPLQVVWFTPGVIHRLVNDGDLQIIIVMQTAVSRKRRLRASLPAGFLESPTRYHEGADCHRPTSVTTHRGTRKAAKGPVRGGVRGTADVGGAGGRAGSG